VFEGLRKIFGSGEDSSLPDNYEPRCYNCLVETVPKQYRNAVYQELKRINGVRYSHVLPDGRIQLSLHLAEGLKAINAVVKDKVVAYKVSKIHLLEIMMTDPDADLTVFRKTEGSSVLHAEKIYLSQISLDSEEEFRKGVGHHKKKQYEQAVKYYDQAIKIEPDDIRAWYNKITALAQIGRHEEAIEAAEQILGKYPNVGILWEAKSVAHTLAGETSEARKCISKADQLNPKLAKKHESQFGQGPDKILQELNRECEKSGRNPNTDVEFWMEKCEKAMGSKRSEEALICLQMAATIGPDWLIVSDSSAMTIFAPGQDEHVKFMKELVPDVKVRRLGDFYRELISGKNR